MSNVTGPDNAPDRDQKFEQLAEAYQGSILRLCYLTLCDYGHWGQSPVSTFPHPELCPKRRKNQPKD